MTKTKQSKSEVKKSLELFKELSNFNKDTGFSEIISIENDYKGKYKCLEHKNGGDWNRKSACKDIKLAVMNANNNINYRWEPSDDEKENIIKQFTPFKNIPTESNGNKILYIGIFGFKNKEKNRTIREDIKAYHKKIPCVACGKKTGLECDHKNDLYNDPRVLNIRTQTKEDFQSLCSSCNCQKRQVIKKCKETGKRYGATNIPALKIYGIDFIKGDDTFDKNDINAMVGTYWYDPIAFHKGIQKNLQD
jgi:hypothetical protein